MPQEVFIKGKTRKGYRVVRDPSSLENLRPPFFVMGADDPLAFYPLKGEYVAELELEELYISHIVEKPRELLYEATPKLNWVKRITDDLILEIQRAPLDRNRVLPPTVRADCNPSGIHGELHMEQVRLNGLAILERGPELKIVPRLVELFAALHDSMRVHDGPDCAHGRRAADLAKRLNRAGILGIADDVFEDFYETCRGHCLTRPPHSNLARVCWDADRLDLPRVGMKVDARKLGTQAAVDIARERGVCL